MEVRELRIGNCLRFVDKIVFVSSIFKSHFRCVDSNGIDYSTSVQSNYQPIELTPEILEAAGFEKCYESEYQVRYDYFVISKGNMAGIEVQIFKEGLINFLYKGEKMRSIKYLHELQNITHALTNIELTIKEITTQ